MKKKCQRRHGKRHIVQNSNTQNSPKQPVGRLFTIHPREHKELAQNVN